jgi:DNA-directed RNA polymerase specialized sigma24 family protein
MQLHRTARTTPVTRQLMVDRVRRDGWTYAETAEAFTVSAPTVRKWVERDLWLSQSLSEPGSGCVQRSLTATGVGAR